MYADGITSVIPPTQEGVVIEGMFPVLTKQAIVQPFRFNWAQKRLDQGWTSRNLIPKARQLGVSTFVLARWTAACLMRENINAVVVSHESNATQRLLQKVHFFLDNMRGPPPDVKTSRNRVDFKRTGSSFYIGTAGSDTFGRGDTVHLLHCSEYAFWENGPTLLGGMLAGVPMFGSEVAIESTGRGHNDYAKRCLRAIAKDGVPGAQGYRCHFLNWLEEPSYRIPLTEEQERELLGSLDKDLEEDKLYEEGVLTAEQLAFRRHTILEEYDGDLRMFKQEYPITLDECFQASGNSIFWKVNFVQTPKWRQVERKLWMLEGHPHPHYSYVVGADVGGGVGADNSVVEGFCLETNEQVLEWADNGISPDAFAFKIKECGQKLNNAFAVPENNNHGIVTVAELEKIYPMGLIYYGKGGRSKDEVPELLHIGFRTSAQSKPLAVGRFRKRVATDLVIHSPALKSEMDTFIETESGKLEAGEGFLDDRVMASAIAQMGWNEAAARAEGQKMVLTDTRPDPFSFEHMFDKKRKGGGFPIPYQHVVH